ncbi:MarR family transcriptional regulator [Chelativorans sp. ZYF759]|uniref:MarR family winged helix-turn-helix transcriptional regulator n=1 Tax=Chelativorans sp. ZYF759 TaxID=2692213 RepID=UPI00145F3A40|nr:MarR family transcriptional regulator [Chelativorans sp. ZYF759]NMG41097.1 MarR family transcriptional regulator [Chelativorans sp. ZYF759]
MNELDDALFLVAVTDESESETHHTLSFSRSTTVLLTFAANRFTRSASRFYQQRFGMGAMDWRMLVMLTREPDASVSRASAVIGIDKAAVSRSLGRLEEAGLAIASTPTSNPRRRSWRLTKKGHQLHGEILEVALSRQRRLLEGFSAEEVERMNDMLRRFMANLEAMDAERQSDVDQ